MAMSRSSSSASSSQRSSVLSKKNSYFDMNFSMDITNKMRVPEQITLASVANQDGRSGEKHSTLMEIPERIVISGEEDEVLESNENNEEDTEKTTVSQKMDGTKTELGAREVQNSPEDIAFQLQHLSDRLTVLEAESRAQKGREVILCAGILLYMIFRGISSYAVQNLNRF